MAEDTRKPRVCILIGAFHPVIGGGETHARILGRELVRNGTGVLLVTRRTARALPRYEVIDGICVHRVRAPASPRLGKYAMLVPALLKLIALRREYDVIYVCALRVLGIAGVLAARLLGKRCILRSEACGEWSGDFICQRFHAEPPVRLNPLLTGMLAWRNRFYLAADRFLSISQVIDAEYVAGGVPAGKHVSISCGIDTDRFRPVDLARKAALRQALGLPDRFIFAYAGKLNKGKGLELLLDAWQAIVQQRNDVLLLLVGGGHEHSLSNERALRAQVRKTALDGHVCFTGYVHNVESYLQASDAFVFPSLKESFGLAPLEAMACGLPVITTRVGELPYLLTDKKDALLVAPGRVDALREAMDTVLTDQDLAAALAAEGARTVAARLGIGRVAALHETLFATVCSGEEESDINATG